MTEISTKMLEHVHARWLQTTLIAGNPPTGGDVQNPVLGLGYSYLAAANSVNAGFGNPPPWGDFLRST